MFSLLLIVLIGGVHAEDISGDSTSETIVSDAIQTDISSCDIVSSNYLTDSEVSDSAQINDENSDEYEKVSSTIDVDEMSNGYCISSDLESNAATNPASFEVGKIKHMSIDYCVGSSFEEIDQVSSPALEVGNSQNIPICYTLSCDFTDYGVTVPTAEVENCIDLSVDYSNPINQDCTCAINPIDVSEELDFSITAQNCIIQKFVLENVDSIESILADVSSDIEASENSNLGRVVTTRDKNLSNFESVDVVFVITTEGILILNGKTSEPAIEGILDYAEYISHNIGEEVYLGSISGGMSNSDWKEVFNAIGAENIVFVSLADGFNESISLYVLQEASLHRQICEEYNSGYTITKELLQYYPPAKETLNGQTDKGNIIVMDKDSNLLGSNSKDEQYLEISSANFNGIDLCNPLWFNFILKQSDGSLMSIYMRNNEDNFFIEDYNWTQTYNLISTLYNSALLSGISESAYPDGIDKAIAINYQWPSQDLSNYATSESKLAVQSQDYNESLGLEKDSLSANSLEGINNEDLLKSVATNIDNAKDKTKTNINAKNGIILKTCKCPKCNHNRCNCSNCNCSKMNCFNLNNSKCHCNCSNHHYKHWHWHNDYEYSDYITYDYAGEVIDKIAGSYGMLADNSTDKNSTDNVTASSKGPFNVPKPIEPTNFNTLIISIAGVLGLGILFGISHRRQEN